MPYCTVAQVMATLVRRPGLGGGPADVGDEVITSQIEAAQAEVDIALATRFVIPFDDDHVPTVITQATIAIAAYLTTLVHRQSVGLGVADDDPALRRYDWAIAALTSLANGDADLPAERDGTGTEEPAPPHGRTVSTINIAGPPGLFSPADFGLGTDLSGRWS